MNTASILATLAGLDRYLDDFEGSHPLDHEQEIEIRGQHIILAICTLQTLRLMDSQDATKAAQAACLESLDDTCRFLGDLATTLADDDLAARAAVFLELADEFLA